MNKKKEDRTVICWLQTCCWRFEFTPKLLQIENTLIEIYVPNREKDSFQVYTFIFIPIFCPHFHFVFRSSSMAVVFVVDCSFKFRCLSDLRHWFDCTILYRWVFTFAFNPFLFFSLSTTRNFSWIVSVCSIPFFLSCYRRTDQHWNAGSYLCIHLFGALHSIPFEYKMVQWCKL